MLPGCNWESIDAFRSLAEYRQFLSKMQADVATGVVEQLPVDPAKGWGTAFKEHWFRCPENHEIWRLVAPDPPFPGVFDRI